MQVRRLNHCVYHCTYHIVLPTKYRRKIFNDGIFSYFEKRLKKIEHMYPQIHIELANHDKDHIHLLVSIAPSIKVCDVVRVIKSFLSRDITKKYDFLKYVYFGTDDIWSDGYFVSTIGLDEKQIRRYIEMQGLEDSGQIMELFD